MALSFTHKGKPVNVPAQPNTLDEAMTPLSMTMIPVATGEMLDAIAKTVPWGEAPLVTHLAKLDISAQVQEQQVAASVAQEPQSIVTEEADSEVLTMIDRYTELQAEINAHDIAHLLKEQDDIKKKLQSIAKSEQYPTNKPVQLYGTHKNYVEFSAASSTTKISDKHGLVAAMSVDVYIENTDITLTAAKKVLPENVLAKYTTTVPGSRTMKNVVLGD